jgi:GNAT superfamily N-acetyltransferase
MHIRRATLDDISDITDVAAEAMAQDEVIGLRSLIYPYGSQYALCRRHSMQRRAKRRFYDPSFESFVMVTDDADADWNDTEHIIATMTVGTTVCRPTLPFGQRLWLAVNSTLHNLEDLFFFDIAASTANTRVYLAAQSGINYAALLEPQGADHHFVTFLATKPSHQRKGIGRAMLEHAQGRAANDGFSLMLTASTVGLSLYHKCGFRIVAQLPLPEGCDFQEPIMLWDPPAQHVKGDGFYRATRSV